RSTGADRKKNWTSCRSLRQWIWSNLELHKLARRPPAAFHVERRTRRDARPDALPLPTCLRIVDAAVNPLRVEAHRIGDTEGQKLAVDEGQESFRLVSGGQ